jgi:nucleoside-diphosphate-sugar epimerase
VSGKGRSVHADGAKPRAVLVTGGLGFIGSFVSESLAARGDVVTVVDAAVSSVVEAGELEPGTGSIRAVVATVDDFLDQRGSLGGFELVVHCASYVGPAMILAHVGRIAPAILATTARLVEACIEDDVPLVNLSSAEVYGYSGVLVEDADVRIPPRYNARIEYALGKLSGEAICINSRGRGLRSVVVRPFNVAGPRQSRFGGFVLPTFVQQALAGEPLTVFAGGEQKRAFLSVGDLCRFICDHLDRDAFDDPRVFNIGNPANVTTIHALALRVRELLSSSSKIVFTDGALVHGPAYEEAESFEKLPDVRNASELGWAPRVSLDELIEETAEYYRQHPDRRADSLPTRATPPGSTRSVID